MIGVTKLLCDTEHFGNQLRYVESAAHQKHGTHSGSGPIVVWNCTRTCNLNCIHCYANSDGKTYPGELTTAEGKKLIDDLKAFHVPVLLFSGGEPMLRPDFFELVGYAREKGLRVTVSTNGTLIDEAVAKRLKEAGVGYVGISLDGIGANHDAFRKSNGAFDKALAGIRNCKMVGQKVGLRFTLNRHNYEQLADVFDLIEKEGINRVCFYHLAYSGRGSEMIQEDMTHGETRKALDLIAQKAIEFGEKVEILTVDNHADGVYLYMKALENDAERAESIHNLIRMSGGNRSGIAIANIDYLGNVHPDQFTQNHTFGNVKERYFGDIWTDESHPILAGLKDRKMLLKGRCAQCKWLAYCNGNFRSRAEAVTGDFWGSDPGCYLTNAEIGVDEQVGLL